MDVAGVRVKKVSRLKELGVTGLEKHQGVIFEEFLRELQGHRANKIYREMALNHPVISGSLLAYKNLILDAYEKGSYQVEPASEDSESMRAVEFVEEAIDDMNVPFREVINEALSVLEFGWSYHEIVYKRRGGDVRDPKSRSKYTDNRLTWRKIPIRAQETLHKWLFDEDGGIQGMVQRDPEYSRDPFIEIPIDKALLFRTTTEKGNPEGRSILRSAYTSWYYQKHLKQIEAVGIERDLAGMPVGLVPPEVLDESNSEYTNLRNTLIDILTNIRKDAQMFVLWPKVLDEAGNDLYEFKLMGGGDTRGSLDTNMVINRYDRDIAIAMLSDILLLGHEKVGSFALSETKAQIFTRNLEGLADSIDGVFNRHAIPDLLRINGFRQEQFPTLRHGKIEYVDLASLGEYIAKLSGAGIPLFPDAELENALRRFGRLPDRPEDFDDMLLNGPLDREPTNPSGGAPSEEEEEVDD